MSSSLAVHKWQERQRERAGSTRLHLPQSLALTSPAFARRERFGSSRRRSFSIHGVRHRLALDVVPIGGELSH